ncbi:MAG: hypothetical protein ABI134_22050 [Byssovorax sp.]
MARDPESADSLRPARGHLLYLTRVANRIVGGRYPYIGELVNPFEVLSIEMLAPDHPVYALRPASPLAIVPAACFYSPRNSFVYRAARRTWARPTDTEGRK